MKTLTVLAFVGGIAYLGYRAKQAAETAAAALVAANTIAPPNSGPVVNGIGDNIFNQPWRAQQAFTGGRNAVPVVRSTTAPPMQAAGPTYRFPRQPSFWRGF